MNSDIAILVSHLSKKYFIGKEKENSLRSTIARTFQSSTQKTEEFRALSDVSFEIKKGDVIGIIGKNGAGKSTLLKILSQITKPSEGCIEISGRVASLLEVGTGFHPELTGRENIYLNGTILGMTRKEVKEKFDEIVSFSGVEKFIDTPVKHYSSGMYVRLAFAVAAHLEPEILIIDEVLAVGDSEFQKKCIGKMRDVANQGRTVLFVSHNIAAIKALCTKGLLLDKGNLLYNGEINDVISHYYKLSNDNSKLLDLNNFENEYIKVNNFQISPLSGEIITVDSGFKFNLDFDNYLENATIDATFELRNMDDVIVFHRGNYIDDPNKSKKGSYSVTGRVEPNTLNAGTYFFNLIFGQNSSYLLLHCPEILSFDIENSPDENGYKLYPGILKPDINLQTTFANK